MAIQFPTLSGAAANPPFPTLSQIERQQSRLFGQLASGNRLISAAVDPAAVAIAEALTSQINGQAQAQNNIVDAQSLLNTSDSALGSQQTMLQQERTLTLQAGDAALAPDDQQIIQGQIQQLNAGLSQVGQQAQFNGIVLLNGGAATLNVQAGPDAGQVIPAALPSSNAQALGTPSVDVTTSAGQQAALAQVDRAIATTSANRETMGATKNRLSLASDNAATAQENAMGARSQLADTNIAQASVQLSSTLFQQQFTLFALQQQANSFALTSTLLVG